MGLPLAPAHPFFVESAGYLTHVFSVTRRFSASPETISEVRRLVWEMAVEWEFEGPEDVAMVINELATNAVRHAATDYTVTVDYDPPVVRVEVRDRAQGMPVLGAGPSAESGIGLLVVDTLSQSWGARRSPDGGKVVWAEVTGLTNRPR
jgi:anti-sigma regulatory factor (Ser/Thr protein kinase)